jgi:hypothetical protein
LENCEWEGQSGTWPDLFGLDLQLIIGVVWSTTLGLRWGSSKVSVFTVLGERVDLDNYI